MPELFQSPREVRYVEDFQGSSPLIPALDELCQGVEPPHPLNNRSLNFNTCRVLFGGASYGRHGNSHREGLHCAGFNRCANSLFGPR